MLCLFCLAQLYKIHPAMWKMQICWHSPQGAVRRGPEQARKITAIGFFSCDSLAFLSGTQPRKEKRTWKWPLAKGQSLRALVSPLFSSPFDTQASASQHIKACFPEGSQEPCLCPKGHGFPKGIHINKKMKRDPPPDGFRKSKVKRCEFSGWLAGSACRTRNS